MHSWDGDLTSALQTGIGHRRNSRNKPALPHLTDVIEIQNGSKASLLSAAHREWPAFLVCILCAGQARRRPKPGYSLPKAANLTQPVAKSRCSLTSHVSALRPGICGKEVGRVTRQLKAQGHIGIVSTAQDCPRTRKRTGQQISAL